MRVHLLDGTYELFRQFFGQPSRAGLDGGEIGAARGVVLSVLGMLERGDTHLGVATDHVIESFRNTLWPGYKTGEGVAAELRSQFEILEEALSALGVTVWPMVELEADDALASAAFAAAARFGRRTGRDLDTRQGSRAVRRGGACRAARPPDEHRA